MSQRWYYLFGHVSEAQSWTMMTHQLPCDDESLPNHLLQSKLRIEKCGSGFGEEATGFNGINDKHPDEAVFG